MQAFSRCFGRSKAIIGMIHVQALPGTPRHALSPAKIQEDALKEADALIRGGVDALLIENMHDLPYLKGKVGPEITANMAVIAHEIKRAYPVPVGMQILAGANREALAVAQAARLDFVRVEGYVFGHVADEGWIEASAGELLRYRKLIGAEEVLVFSDIKKKHSAHAITQDVSLVETAHAAEFFHSDGLIVTGAATGQSADPEEVQAVKASVALPVMVGSGVRLDNLADYYQAADGLIIGSWFKEQGLWDQAVDYERVAAFMEKVESLRT